MFQSSAYLIFSAIVRLPIFTCCLPFPTVCYIPILIGCFWLTRSIPLFCCGRTFKILVCLQSQIPTY